MCILWLLDPIFCVCLLQLSQVLLEFIVSLLIFCLDDISIDVSGVLLRCCQFLLFLRFLKIYLGAPMLDTYTPKIITSSC